MLGAKHNTGNTAFRDSERCTIINLLVYRITKKIINALQFIDGILSKGQKIEGK